MFSQRQYAKINQVSMCILASRHAADYLHSPAVLAKSVTVPNNDDIAVPDLLYHVAACTSGIISWYTDKCVYMLAYAETRWGKRLWPVCM